MQNNDLADIFRNISYCLEMEEARFRSYAYQKAAFILETMNADVKEIYEKGGINALRDISGIGKNIAEKTEEYLKTGRVRYYDELKKKIPINFQELVQVEGLGIKRIKVLYQELGVKNLKNLKKAAEANKIASLTGFGEKSERNILEWLKFFKKNKRRFLLGEVLPWTREFGARLKETSEIEKIDVAGSVRRMKATVGDVDFLAISNYPERAMALFVSRPEIKKILAKGIAKSSCLTKLGFNIDIRVLPRESYGSALQYFTGSKEHNIALRKIAISKGLKLSEYGLFKKKKIIAGATEEGVYKTLGLQWIPPEMRENQGEIEAALSGELPKIIGLTDIRGDLHCHSNWNGGKDSIKEMAESARSMGYEYMGVSDHTKFLKIERGLDEKILSQQRKEINKMNLEFSSQNIAFHLLQGCEANILKDGSIDIKDYALKRLDYAIAGIHSNFKMGKKEMTERVIRAIKNPNIDIISHPIGRILKKREEYQIDFGKILRAAKEYKTILEINSSPKRLDLSDSNIRIAKETGVKMAINTDSHRKEHLKFMELGVGQARRGWAEKKDIVNAWPLEKLVKFFKKTN